MDTKAFKAPFRGIVFDIGDVLFRWSFNADDASSRCTLRQALASPTWDEYLCGRIAQSQCYELVAKDLSVEPSQVAKAFDQARSSLQASTAVMDFIRSLKEDRDINVYAMSNMAKEDFAALADKFDWTLFDRTFISGEVGMRKPDPTFFRYVLREICLTPKDIVFVDDKETNVLAARKMGIRSLIYGKTSIDDLQRLLSTPVSRGIRFLYRNAKHFDSFTDSGVRIQDNFAQLLILEATQDRNLVQIQADCTGTWNYFAKQATLVPGGYFPDDLDTTSLALSVLCREETQAVKSILDEMTKYMNPDGSFLTYFDRQKLRTDATVTANVLACFYGFGRGTEFSKTLQYLSDVLLHRTYLAGTRYYPSSDCCLSFFTRMWQYSRGDKAPHTQDLEKFRVLLRARVLERIGEKGCALDLAMRVLACIALDLDCKEDCTTLLQLQCQDGGWEGGWMYRYGSTGIRIGNRGVTTTMAIKAISQVQALWPVGKSVVGGTSTSDQ